MWDDNILWFIMSLYIILCSHDHTVFDICKGSDSELITMNTIIMINPISSDYLDLDD